MATVKRNQHDPDAREAAADRRRAAGPDRLRRAVRGRLARPRARPGRAVRRVAPVAARGAADPRDRGPHHRRARRARGRRRPRAGPAHDRPHRGARAPGAQRRRSPTSSRPGACSSRSRPRRSRRSGGATGAVEELRELIDAEEAAIEDPEAFGVANAAFHERLVALAGNQTLTIVAEMLNEIVARGGHRGQPGRRRRRLAVGAPARHPVPGAPARPDRGGRRRRGRGALAGAHAGRRQGHARPGGLDRRRPPPPLRLTVCRNPGFRRMARGRRRVERPRGPSRGCVRRLPRRCGAVRGARESSGRSRARRHVPGAPRLPPAARGRSASTLAPYPLDFSPAGMAEDPQHERLLRHPWANQVRLARYWMRRAFVADPRTASDAIRRALHGADVLVTHPTFGAATVPVAQHLGVPSVVGQLFPMMMPTGSVGAADGADEPEPGPERPQPPRLATGSPGARVPRCTTGRSIAPGAHSVCSRMHGNALLAWTAAERTVVLLSRHYFGDEPPDWGDWRLVGFSAWPGPARRQLDGRVEAVHRRRGRTRCSSAWAPSAAAGAGRVFASIADDLRRQGHRALLLVGQQRQPRPRAPPARRLRVRAGADDRAEVRRRSRVRRGRHPRPRRCPPASPSSCCRSSSTSCGTDAEWSGSVSASWSPARARLPPP